MYLQWYNALHCTRSNIHHSKIHSFDWLHYSIISYTKWYDHPYYLFPAPQLFPPCACEIGDDDEVLFRDNDAGCYGGLFHD